jgi:hypothetical protein
MIHRIREAVRNFPYPNTGDYRAWPLPNSNTFVTAIMSAVPDRLCRSSCEAAEQSRVTGSGGGGAKGREQGGTRISKARTGLRPGSA